MSKYFLLTTVGRTDIKICLQKQSGEEKVYEIQTKDTFKFHEWLKQNYHKIDFSFQPPTKG